jgi:hypothetical protein
LFLFLSPQPLSSASLPRNPEGIHFHFPPSFFKRLFHFNYLLLLKLYYYYILINCSGSFDEY